MWGSPEVCYTADRKAPELFVKELRRYDDKLFVRWNNKFRRFEIWRKACGRAHDSAIHILPVKFPALDNRTINLLKRCDLWRYGRKPYGRCNDIWRDIDNYNDHVELARNGDLRNMCEGIASDHLWFAAKRFFGNPKSRAYWNLGGTNGGINGCRL